MVTREWNATAYDALPLPHVEWGRRVVDRLADGLAQGTRVLDAGCGTGRDAAELLTRRPDARVVCVDGSANMIEQARGRLGDRVEYRVADLAEPLEIEPVDAIMSVAAFHWIADHDALFANLAQVVRPGGRLVSDCGGEGQLAIVNAALAAVLGQPDSHWTFRGVAETEAALRAGGWEPQRVDLRPDPLRLEDPDLLEAYLATVCLGSHLAGMDEREGIVFVRAVREAMTEPVIDYVRLEIEAERVTRPHG